VKQGDAVRGEEDRDDDGQACQVPFDDVGPALRGGREAHPAEAGVAARVHEDQPTQGDREQNLKDSEHLDHPRQGISAEWQRRSTRSAAARKLDPSIPKVGVTVDFVDTEGARARIQKLLVTGDNRLKQGVDPVKVRASYEQALDVAREAGLEDAVRPLVELRLADLQRLAGESAPPAPPDA